jgi:hypothetical protein
MGRVVALQPLGRIRAAVPSFDRRHIGEAEQEARVAHGAPHCPCRLTRPGWDHRRRLACLRAPTLQNRAGLPGARHRPATTLRRIAARLIDGPRGRGRHRHRRKRLRPTTWPSCAARTLKDDQVARFEAALRFGALWHPQPRRAPGNGPGSGGPA